MSIPNPSLKKLADEAEFQMTAAKDQIEWFAAIARAILRDVEHNAGRDVLVLAQLANYLGASGAGSAESAIEMFAQIVRDGTAPQNADLIIRGADVEGGQ